jgi:hypothetical protein
MLKNIGQLEETAACLTQCTTNAQKYRAVGRNCCLSYPVYNECLKI